MLLATEIHVAGLEDLGDIVLVTFVMEPLPGRAFLVTKIPMRPLLGRSLKLGQTLYLTLDEDQ